MPRFMLTSLSKSRPNLEIVEIRQVHRVMYISSMTDRGRTVFLCGDASYGAYLGRLTFPKIQFEIGRSSHF